MVSPPTAFKIVIVVACDSTDDNVDVDYMSVAGSVRCTALVLMLVDLISGLPFSRGFADFRENEVSESAKKKTNPRKKIRPNVFLKRQLKLTQTASKLQRGADDRILHLVFALRFEISRDPLVAIVF